MVRHVVEDMRRGEAIVVELQNQARLCHSRLLTVTLRGPLRYAVEGLLGDSPERTLTESYQQPSLRSLTFGESASVFKHLALVNTYCCQPGRVDGRVAANSSTFSDR